MLRAYGWEPLAGALESARGRHARLAELLRFYETSLERVHATPVELDLSRLEPSRLQLNLVRGEPLLGRGRFIVDLGATARLFDELSGLLAERGPGPASAVQGIRTAQRDGRLEIEALTSRAIAAPGGAEALARERSLDPEVLAFLVRWSLWPSLEACAARLEEWARAIGWDGNLCPLCGSGAGLAELRGDEGVRVLHCSFCGWEWGFPRSGCPYCGNIDHQTIEVLYVEEDRRAHLSVCHACNAYVKTVDNKEFRGLIPVVEDLASPYLDLLAAERGYQRIVF